MPITSGLVDYLKVGGDYGFVGLREEGTNELELFIIWFFPEEPSAFDRILHSMQLSLLQDALVSRLRVRISHEEESALITQVQVDAAEAPPV
jgi:hypothetical protein